ncbi:MAG TPA: autotransporter outer membrane beta-barrel domain-containing protein, partial [Achromobacter sp.]|nr:autotransporter outer membrane beta-barrel domain-containing protein [Achromobacter sp.]
MSNNFRLGTGGLALDGTQGLTVSGLLTGTGALRVTGAQTVTLTGANDYSGGTTVNVGASLAGNAASLQGNIVNNGTVTFSTSTNGSYGGVMSGSGNLVKEGAATLTVNNLLGHQGNTTIRAGTLRLGASGSLNPLAMVDLHPFVVLDLSGGANQSINGLSGAGGTVTLGATTLSLSNVNTATFGGVIAGSGGLVKNGLQTQTLTGANTFTGGVNIGGGTLALGAGGSLAASSVMTVGALGTFDISAASNTTLAALNGLGGDVALGANTLTLGAGAYDGVIAGTGGVTKNTAGSLALNGVNTYTGATHVSAGELLVGGS